MIDDHERGRMPAVRDLPPLHIVTVCVRGRDTYPMAHMSKRVLLLDRLIEALAQRSGWSKIDAVLLPGGFFGCRRRSAVFNRSSGASYWVVRTQAWRGRRDRACSIAIGRAPLSSSASTASLSARVWPAISWLPPGKTVSSSAWPERPFRLPARPMARIRSSGRHSTTPMTLAASSPCGRASGRSCWPAMTALPFAPFTARALPPYRRCA